jgi:hypothetical protein
VGAGIEPALDGNALADVIGDALDGEGSGHKYLQQNGVKARSIAESGVADGIMFLNVRFYQVIRR